MKQIKYFILALFSVLLLTGCENEYERMFGDDVAYVAFGKTSYEVAENIQGGVFNLPIWLASVSGLEATVTVAVVAGGTTAVAGEHYNLLNNTVNFTSSNRSDFIKIEILDDDIFKGNFDIKLDIVTISNSNVSTLIERETVVTIIDDEHPLKDLFGNWTFTGTGARQGAQTFTVTLGPDAADFTYVKISGIDFYYDEGPILMTASLSDLKVEIFKNGYRYGAFGNYGPWEVGLYVSGVTYPTVGVPGTISADLKTITFNGTLLAVFSAGGSNAGVTLERWANFKLTR